MTQTMQQIITDECDALKHLLLKKNESYGNSAAEPINIFSKASAIEQINVRIDDKLKRLRDGQEFENEDTEQDLIGYLILRRCVKKALHTDTARSHDSRKTSNGGSARRKAPCLHGSNGAQAENNSNGG